MSYLELAESQLRRVQTAAVDPPDQVEAVTFAFYAYENAAGAVAAVKNLSWPHNHYKKAEIASKLFTDRVLSKDIGGEMLRLNGLRKCVNCGEPGPELEEIDLEDLANGLEDFTNEVARILDETEEA